MNNIDKIDAIREKAAERKAQIKRIEKVIAKTHGSGKGYAYFAVIDGAEVPLRAKSTRLYDNAFAEKGAWNPGRGLAAWFTYGKKPSQPGAVSKIFPVEFVG